MNMIPIYQPWITDIEKDCVNDALNSGWVSSAGEYINALESIFAHYVGAEYAVATNSGTSALHLSLLAAGVGPNHKVAVPDLTFVATANAVKYCGAEVILCDVDPHTWNMEIHNFPANIDVVIPVHLFGNPVVTEGVGVPVIEDACEAIGATIDGKHVGHSSLMACYSFFANKTITTGEGGMITTNSAELYKKLIHLRGHAQTQQYYHDAVGYNYRMTNLQAALGYAQMTRLSEIQHAKQRVFNTYRNELSKSCLEGVVNKGCTRGNWIFAVYLHNCDKIAQKLHVAGYETRVMFKPLHTMPMYKTEYRTFEYSTRLSEHILMLPSYPELSNEHIYKICNVIKQSGM